MFKHYYGYIKFQRFFGVKAGRSVWNDAFIRTHYHLLLWGFPFTHFKDILKVQSFIQKGRS
jgi:hypothetical protein